MTEQDELEEIRQRKRQQLQQRLEEGGDIDGDGPDSDSDTGSDSDADGSPAAPIHVESETHLSDLVATHDVVLVDFYADWCGPCRMLEPTVEALAAETAAAVAKVDIDAHQSLASQYQVRGVPTLLLFADGQPIERVVGVEDKGTLASLVSQYAD